MFFFTFFKGLTVVSTYYYSCNNVSLSDKNLAVLPYLQDNVTVILGLNHLLKNNYLSTKGLTGHGLLFNLYTLIKDYPLIHQHPFSLQNSEYEDVVHTKPFVTGLIYSYLFYEIYYLKFL